MTSPAEYGVETSFGYDVPKNVKERCSRHLEQTVDVTISCGNETRTICTNCGAE